MKAVTSNLRLQPAKFMNRILPNTGRSTQPWSWIPQIDHITPERKDEYLSSSGL